MRNAPLAPSEHYHIIARSAEGNTLFRDQSDYIRFLYVLLLSQSPDPVNNIAYAIAHFKEHKTFPSFRKTEERITKDKNATLVAFTLMPNHMHMILREDREGGISRSMHKVLTAYAKYFNEKYAHVGHVFQGPYRAVHITNDTQLLYTSAYIHKNQSEIRGWRGREEQYQWSSLQDYVVGNRWGRLLDRDIILGQFKDRLSYWDFVRTSTAKELEEYI